YFAAHLPRFRLTLKADGLDVAEDVEPKFVLTVEGTPEKVKAKLAARYGQSVTVPVSPSAVHLGYASGGGPDGRRLILRQEVKERTAGRLLTEAGFRHDPAAETYEAVADAALDFWAKGKSSLPREWEMFAAAPPKVRIRAKVKPRIRVNMSTVNWFDLDADFVTEDQSVDLGAVRMWLDSGRRYVALADGSFAEADLGELKVAADLLEEAGAMPGKKQTRLALFHAPALDLLGGLSDVEIDAKARRAMQELKEIDGIPTVKPPPGFEGTLRHYQEAGMSWLWFLYRHGLSGVLADDMGLGKTVQALTLLLKAKIEEGSKPSMVIAPTSVLANWEREVTRFAPSLTTVTWHGQDRREKAEALKGVDIVLTSYSLIRRDVKELEGLDYRLVVLDEAQNIKNADSATAQAVKTLKADSRLALTGTPLENRLSELWSQFDFLMPGFLGSADGFHDRFEHPIMVQGDMEVRDRLKRRIHPFVLRRLKTEVAKDLPPKTETVTFCEMEPGQAALYREVLDESKKKVYDHIDKMGFNRSRVSILAALMRLRQVCCDPRLLKLPPGTALPPSAKLARFSELVDDLVAEGHRALVFSQFTEMLEILKGQAEEKKLQYMYLDGRTKDRMSKVDAFNDPKGPPIFFISLKAGGTGLNLTAADYVIHYDPWWNPAVEDQATDRTHRIGQTRPVFSYKLITKGTVEEKILALQQRKRELAAGVLGTDAEVGKALTEKDVEELFRYGD
ncbi:MAG: DEAD/DEAH box helicase, partial [Myxococcaceae bacterium]|nr:DEAD/DEAH box helicase [Myxococcaceae bacterium]